MRLICPSCGAVASIDAWLNDAHIREAVKIIAGMPAGIPERVLGYLALFRPAAGRGLGWARARRLLVDLDGLVKKDCVEWDRKPARPNDPALWAKAMQLMADRNPPRLPLKSHGYLASIVYELADDADRKREVAQNRAERDGSWKAGRGEGETGRGGEPERIDAETMRRIREERFGRKKGDAA